MVYPRVTLQELLAPSRVFFIAAHWNVFGHKCSHAVGRRARNTLQACPKGGPCAWGRWVLNPFISSVVNIELDIINGHRDIAEVTPEEICHWVKQRQTKKEEDLAYCLLGLLGVYLVPLYGECENAWSRLEQEVTNKLQRACLLPTPVFSTPGRRQQKKEDLARRIVRRRVERLQRLREEQAEHERWARARLEREHYEQERLRQELQERERRERLERQLLEQDERYRMESERPSCAWDEFWEKQRLYRVQSQQEYSQHQSLWNTIWNRGQDKQSSLHQTPEPIAQHIEPASSVQVETEVSTGGDRPRHTAHTYPSRRSDARRDETVPDRRHREYTYHRSSGKARHDDNTSEDTEKSESSRNTAWVPRAKLADRNSTIRLSGNDEDSPSVIEEGGRSRAGIRQSAQLELE